MWLLRWLGAGVLACACVGSAAVNAADCNSGAAPAIKHVFVITLENEGFDATFSPHSKAPYLSKTLVSQGALLTQYYATGHASLDNYIAMISGQAATEETRADCVVYSDFIKTGTTPDGQAIGKGCVYPAAVKTLPDQLAAAGRTWRAYMEDMGNDPGRESPTCGHPKLNGLDNSLKPEAPSPSVPLGDQYATRHNPFVYFHSIIDSPDCARNVVSLDQLTRDLTSEASTPNFVFITPNVCNDCHDEKCVNGQPGGFASIDVFLRKWVPLIMASPAYQSGLLVINFDEGGVDVVKGPSGSVISAPGEHCCGQEPGPNLGSFPETIHIGSYTLNFASYGGDRTGAVLLSPFVRPGSVSNTQFNHYSLLRTVEDILKTRGHLGYAGQPGVLGFFECGSDVRTK